MTSYNPIAMMIKAQLPVDKPDEIPALPDDYEDPLTLMEKLQDLEDELSDIENELDDREFDNDLDALTLEVDRDDLQRKIDDLEEHIEQTGGWDEIEILADRRIARLIRQKLGLKKLQCLTPELLKDWWLK